MYDRIHGVSNPGLVPLCLDSSRWHLSSRDASSPVFFLARTLLFTTYGTLRDRINSGDQGSLTIHTQCLQATFIPDTSHDPATKLHHQLMKAADTSTSFFPAEHGTPSTSRANLVGYGTSFVPDTSETFQRKPSNKLVKKRPSKTRSTPPSLGGQSGGSKEDAFVEAVVSNLDMIISKRYGTRKEQYQNASAERSEPGSLKGTYINPPSSQMGQSSGEYSSGGSPSLGLKRAWSARDLHSRQDVDDPFGRGPPVIIGRGAPRPGKAGGNVSGSTVTHQTDAAPLEPTPEDPRGTIIALYRPPPEEISASKQIIGRNEPTKLPSGAVPAERDDTVIAWYKPPPPQNIELPKPRDDSQVQSYTNPALTAPAASAEFTPTKVTPLSRASPQSSPDIASDVPPGLHVEPHLRTRPNDVAHSDAQRAPNLPRSSSCESTILSWPW